MCGRFQLLPTDELETLIQRIGVSGELRYSHDQAPGAQISTIIESNSRHFITATWWLFLDHQTIKPNYKYPSFNSRYDKLNQPRSISYKPFRESRCIIPATAFVEGLGDKRTYHKIELVDRALALGGLYKTYVNQGTGEKIYSASIITLPPVEKWANIHPKSIPLMLDCDDQELIDKWLDPNFQDVDFFTPYLEPVIRHIQRVTPIDRPSKWNPIGESFLLS